MINIDKQYLLNCLKEFIDTPSPVSYFEKVNPLVQKYAKELGYDVFFDNKHTGYIEIMGEDNSKTVMIGAHLDTIGMMVRRINDDGTLGIRQLGGVSFTSAEGESVIIHTREGKEYTGLLACVSHSTHVFDDARTLERNEVNMIVKLDEMAKTKEEVLELGIRHGDIISIDPRFSVTENGYVKTRFIDDKGAVAAVFAALHYMTKENIKPKYKTLLSFPHFEEIGHGGAYIPKEVEEYVAIDIGLIGPDYEGNEKSVSICCKDFHSPYDRGLTTKIIQCAKNAGCDYAIDIFYRYGTDASAALKAGNNVYAAAFGMAVYSSHGMERTHIDGLANTSKLIVAYLQDLSNK